MFARNRVGKAYLYQTVAFVVIISVIPLLIISIYSHIHITDAVSNEIFTTNKRVVALTLESVESILDQVQNSCRILSENRTFFDFHSLPKPLEWYENKTSFETDEELHDIYQYVSLKGNIFDKLTSLKMGMSFIHSVCYIDVKKDVVLTSDRESLSIAGFYDVELVQLLDGSQAQTGIIPRIMTDSFGKSQPVLSFYQGARFLGESQIFVVNISADLLYSYIYKSILSNTNDQLLVLQGDKIVLPGNTPVDQWPEMVDLAMNTDKESVLQKTMLHNDISYSITGIYSSRLYWWFISASATDELLKTEQYISRTIIFISVYMVAVIVIGVCLWSIRWYRPVKKIVSTIQDFGGPSADKENRHELSFIREHLQLAMHERQALKERVALMLPSFRDRYLSALLTGERLPDETFEAEVQAMNVTLIRSNPAVCIFQLSGAIFNDDKGITARIAQSIQISDLINGIVKEYTQNVECISERAGRFACIMNLGEGKTVHLFHVADSVRRSLSAQYQADCYAGLSRIYPEIQYLPVCYEEAEQALIHSMLFTEPSIVHIDELSPSPAIGRKLPVRLPADIFASLRAGEEDAAILALLAYFKKISTAKEIYSFAEINAIFQRIVGKLFDFCEEIGYYEGKAYEQLFAIGQKLRDHNELAALEDLKGAISALSRYCKDARQPRNEDHIAVALEQIKTKYGDDEFSISKLADTIGLNPDYLGRIFKERTGQNFVEYLTAYRIQKSRELLVTTKLRIKDISATVGYSHVNYFIKVFRECVGITPKAYRDREVQK